MYETYKLLHEKEHRAVKQDAKAEAPLNFSEHQQKSFESTRVATQRSCLGSTRDFNIVAATSGHSAGEIMNTQMIHGDLNGASIIAVDLVYSGKKCV